MDFVFLPQVRNTGRRPVPHEPNHWTRAIWKRRRVRCHKYVDDGICIEKANYENVLGDEEEDGHPVRIKHAIPSQNTFRMTKRAAEAKGMKVNTSKTKVLCVSDSLSYRAAAKIEDEEGLEIASKKGDKLKVLGFTFGKRPTVRPHVKSIRKKFRQRFWTLFNLRKNGFNNEELVRV